MQKLDRSYQSRSQSYELPSQLYAVPSIRAYHAPISFAILAYGTDEHNVCTRAQIRIQISTCLRGKYVYAIAFWLERVLHRDGHSQVLNCALHTRAYYGNIMNH